MVNKNKDNNKYDDEDEQFEVIEFVKRHLQTDSWCNERTQVYTAKELHELVKQMMDILKKEPVLATMSPPCTIVGDIHGQYLDLIRILSSRTKIFPEKKDLDLGCLTSRFVFLGDFVDRGPCSVECICLMFALKIIYPKQYALLRGNHETKAINYAYGFREELVNKLGEKDGVEVWEHFNEAFSWMPLAGLVGGRILCMHGGISPALNSLDDIRNIKRPLVDLNENKLALDLLWSDPVNVTNINAVSEEPQFLKNMLRGLSCTFNGPAIRECAKKLNIQLIVRAHQVQEAGFTFSADRKLVTIFSAPRYMNENDNRGAVLKVSISGSISVVTYRSAHAKKKVIGEVTKGVSAKTDKKVEQKTQTLSKTASLTTK